jgi:anti-anti-sigma factor
MTGELEAAEMFSVDVEPAAQAVLFTLRGDLDFSSALQLREAADATLSGHGRPALVVIDCSTLEYCDSSGINSLIMVYQRMAAHGGMLRMAAVPASVAHVFELTSLDKVIAVHPTVADALAAGADVHAPSLDDGAPRWARGE